MDIDKPIEVASNSEFLLISHPVRNAYMYGVEVTIVKKNNETHFILQKSDGSNDEPLIKGHEAAVCLQILRAYGEIVVGSKVSDTHFYAWYNRGWHHIYFNTIDVDKIKKSWPDCDTGEALGTPVIKKIKVLGDVDIPVRDDFSADPFIYWWHTVEAINQVMASYGNELQNALQSKEINVPFGDISYEATEIYAHKAIFAKEHSVANDKLKSLCAPHKVIYQTPLIRIKDRRGWASIAVYFDRLDVPYTIYEPGNHELDRGYFGYIRQALLDAGSLVKIISDESWSATLSTEIDLTTINGFMQIFRRGEHHFTLLEEYT